MNLHKNIYFKFLRVDHWFKNLFLIFGVIAGVWYSGIFAVNADIILNSTIAFFLASFISSANYIINQITDAKFDANHEEKKHRPLPSGKIRIRTALVLMVVMLILGFGIAYEFFSLWFQITLFALFVAGIFYNIPPIRLKDKPLVDVLSESLNNPIRFLLGWFIVIPTLFPPVLVLILAWSAGAILMTAKRYDELLFFGKKLVPYRATFSWYTLARLKFMLFLYSFITFVCLLLITLNYHSNLVFSLPFVGLFMLWILNKIISGEAKARSVEDFVLTKQFLVFSISLLCLFLYLSF